MPAATDGNKTASFDTNFDYLEGLPTTQGIAGVTLTQYQAAYLKPYTRGTLTATPSSTGGALANGNYYAIIVARIPDGPQYPTPTYSYFLATLEAGPISVGGTGAGSIAFSWSAVTGALDYQVWITQIGGGAGAEDYYFTTASTSLTVTSTSTGGTSGTVPTAVMPKQWALAIADGSLTPPIELYLVVVAGAAGAVCYGQKIGIVTDASWNWTPGLVYVSASVAGSLSQSSSELPIGDAISPTEIELFTSGGAGGSGSAGPYAMHAIIPGDGTSPTTSVKLLVPSAGAILAVKSSCLTAPATTYTYDVLKNGSTIYTTTGNRPTRTSGDSVGLKSHASPDITSVAQFDLLQLTVVSAGTSINDVTFYIEIQPSAGGGGTGSSIPTSALTSSVTGYEVPAIYAGSGEPSASTLTPGTYNERDLYFDRQTRHLWICNTSGSESTSAWNHVRRHFSGAGAPSKTTLATGTYELDDIYCDTTNLLFYVCTTAGAVVASTSNASHWTPVSQVMVINMVAPGDPGAIAMASIQFCAPMAGTITAVKSTCRTAAASGTYTYNVPKNGSNLWTTSGNRPTRVNGDGTGLKSHTLPDTLTFAQYDLLQLDVAAVGTGISDFTLYIFYRPTDVTG